MSDSLSDTPFATVLRCACRPPCCFVSQSTRALWLQQDLNTESLQRELDYSNHEQRAAMKKFMNQPLFVPQVRA